MKSRSTSVALCAALATSLFSLSAFAKGDTVKFGAGLGGVIGGNFLDKPSDKSLGNGLTAGDVYPGFAGMTAGGGLMLDARFINLLGIELDVFRTSDKGSGDITQNGVKFHLTIGQSAWHLPVLAKVVIPSTLISPEFLIGPEFVFPGKASLTIDPGTTPTTATASNYTMITFGAGLEIKLPLPALDLRIPIQLRGSVNPGVSNKLVDRVTTDKAYNVTSIKSEWKYQAVATLGVELYF